MKRWRRLSRHLFDVGPLLLVIASSITFCAPLFFVPLFATDWVNHLWLAKYVAANVGPLGVPTFVNVANSIGNPVLSFYGAGLYGVTAPLVAIFGASVGIRLAALASVFIPNFLLYRLLSRQCGSWLAAFVTVILTASIYQQTNLYNRSALTEFFAYQLLLLGLVLLLDCLINDRSRVEAIAGFSLGICSAATAALAHPITAYSSTVILGLPFLTTVLMLRGRIALLFYGRWWLLNFLVIPSMALGAWGIIIATQSAGLDHQRLGIDSLKYFLDSIDHWSERFLPWSFDQRVAAEGSAQVSTPFLTAPLNLSAILLLGALISKQLFAVDGRKDAAFWLFVVAVVLGSGVSIFVSLVPGNWQDALFGRLQFAYRLVNTANALVALGCIVIIITGAKSAIWSTAKEVRAGLALVAVLTCISVAGKSAEVLTYYSGDGGWLSSESRAQFIPEIEDVSRAPGTQYGLDAYSMPSAFPQLERTDRVVTNVPLHAISAVTAVATASCARRCVLETNLIPSPFVEAFWGDERLPRSSMRVSDRHVALFVDGDGTPSKLEMRMGSPLTTVYGLALGGLLVQFWLSAVALLAALLQPRLGRILKKATAKIRRNATP